MGINGEYLTMAQACGEAPVHPRGYVSTEHDVLPPLPPRPAAPTEREQALERECRRLMTIMVEHDVDPGPSPLLLDAEDEYEADDIAADLHTYVDPGEL